MDVECFREYKESLVRYTMNDEEVERIVHAERPEEEFIRLWTMKEAKVKLTGQGISDDMKRVLDGREIFRTVVNEKKGYVYSAIYEKNV